MVIEMDKFLYKKVRVIDILLTLFGLHMFCFLNYKKYIKETLKAESRPTSSGFYKGKVTKKEQIFDKTAEIPLQDFVARVLDYNKETKTVTIEQRNNFTINKQFEVLTPKGIFKLEIKELFDESNEKVEVARHAKQVLHFKSDIEFTNFDMFRQTKTQD